MRRTMTVAAAALLAVMMVGGPAAAHHLVVDPPGGGQGPGEDAWVGGPPLPEAAKGQGLMDGPPTDPGGGDFTPQFLQPPAHGKGLNTACEKLRGHGNSAVDIHGPVETTCHHGP